MVRIHDLIQFDGRLALSMELVEGRSLYERLKRTPQMQADEWMTLARDITRSVAAAHTAGVIHRDLKPANILLRDSNHRAVIADFGLSRLAGDRQPLHEDAPATPAPTDPSLTREGDLLGTPLYMAPEQLLGRDDVGPACDIFSMGVVLFEAAAGHVPHPAKTLQELIATKTRQAATPLEKLRPDLPLGVARFVDRCLRTEPAARFVDGREAKAHLDALFASPTRRRDRALAVAALVAVIAAGGVAFHESRARAPACGSGADRFATVWNPSTRGRIQQRFTASGLVYAATAWQGWVDSIEAYASGWTKMHRDACEATRLRGEQSETVLDTRMSCLNDRLDAVGAVVQLMQRADADMIRDSAGALQKLPAIAECADVRALTSVTRPPQDVATIRRIGAANAALARLQATWAVGKFTEARQLGVSLVSEARAIGYAPLTAQVQLALGRVLADLGDLASISAFKEAFSEALAAREDRVAGLAAARVSQEFIYKNSLDDYRYWARLAEAENQRAGRQVEVDIFLGQLRCVAI